jgi:hypothetical protein
MKNNTQYQLVKLDQFSGKMARIYSFLKKSEQKTLFDIFVEENKNLFLSELKDIFVRLQIIGNDTGAREQYFKLFEGKPGDGVCALYDLPGKKLRLYCIRYGATLVIVGGGGYKSKEIRTLQENEKLKRENTIMVKLSNDISQKIKEREIIFSDDGYGLTGNLTFNIT